MKRNKFLSVALAFVFATSNAFAASIGDDNVDLGKPTSSSNKSITFKGPTSKKKLSGSQAGALSYDGNSLSVGDGLNTANKTFTFDKGGSSPFFQYNFSTGAVDTGNLSILNHTGNELHLGDGTNTNKILKFNKGASSPEIRFNSTTGRMQFTNDAITYKDIGSGSGGGSGTNLLQDFNADFEAQNPPQNWTASGGTFAAETSTPLYGLQSGNWDASALNQTLSSQLVTIERGFIGRKCQAEIEYRYPSGSAGDISLQAVDQVPNILATVALEVTSGSNSKKASIGFDCPSTATDQLRLRLIANVANPGAIVVDNAFIGNGRIQTIYNQTKYLGQVETSGAANCSWIYTTNQAVGGAPTADADCNTAVATGEQAQAPGTKIPAIVLKQVPAGRLKIQMTGSFRDEANPNGCVWAVHNATLGTKLVGTMYGQGSDLEATTLVGEFDVPAGGLTNAQFEIRGGTRYAAGQCSIEVQNTTLNTFRMAAYSYSSGQSEALNLETTGFFVNASIYDPGVTNGFTLGNTNLSTYTEMTSTTGTMELRPGSANAQIPCSTTNPSTGLTCAAGNESMGVVFNAPYAGVYEACMQARYFADYDGDFYDVEFQWVETPNNAQTILQEGGGKQGFHRSGAIPGSQSYALNTCGLFTFASAGQKTLRVMREQLFTGAPNGHFIFTDREPSAGQRDVTITVRPYTQSFPAPVFAELQNAIKGGAPGVVHYAATLGLNGSTCPVNKTVGSWITASSRPSSRRCDVTFTGAFSSPPVCTCSVNDLTTAQSCNVGGTTSSFVQLFTGSTDLPIDVVCTGIK